MSPAQHRGHTRGHVGVTHSSPRRGAERGGRGGLTRRMKAGVEPTESSMLSQTLKPVKEVEKTEKGSTCETAHKTLTN